MSVEHVQFVDLLPAFIDRLDRSQNLLTCLPAALSADSAIAVWILCKDGVSMFVYVYT